MILLDSSILIELFRKKNKRNTLFYEISEVYEDISISTITYYEVGIGNRKSHIDYWNLLSDKLTVLPFNKYCADYAISVYMDLITRNKMIDLADLLIGSTALAHSIPIAKLNVKHFARIKELEIFQSTK